MVDRLSCILRSESANICRSQWPRGLRRRSTAAPLLRSRVRIHPGAWMFVCCVRCVLSGRSLCESWSLVQRTSTYPGASLLVKRNLLRRGRHSLRWAAEPKIVIVTLSLLMSYIYIYIYGAPCKTRNFYIVCIWTYVYQLWKPSPSICCTMFQHWTNAESYPVAQLCVNTLQSYQGDPNYRWDLIR
jgi:hypothetical protein